MAEAPTLTQLQEIADRAVEQAFGEAQATVVWERDGAGERLHIELTSVVEGRAAVAVAAGPGDEALRRVARSAALHARRPRAWPSPGLPDPLPVPAHEGFDPAALAQELQAPECHVRVGAARVAIASTHGVRVAEQRSHAIAEVVEDVRGRRLRLAAAAVSAADLPLQELADHARELLMDGRDPVDLPGGDLHVVLGPDAVATLLDHLRPGFGVELDLGSGPLHGRFGTRVAAAAVNLADSPRHPSTLPRSFDAEGMPRRPVPLIQDGVAHARVHDSASAARAGTVTTGHASRAAALAPVPEHLVLAGGGAGGLRELCEPVRRGVYVPALSGSREADGDGFRHTTHGAVLIDAGELAAPVLDSPVRIEPLAVLASVEALAARTRTLPLSPHAPGGIGAAVVPALRAAGGCRAG